MFNTQLFTLDIDCLPIDDVPGNPGSLRAGVLTSMRMMFSPTVQGPYISIQESIYIPLTSHNTGIKGSVCQSNLMLSIPIVFRYVS